MNLFRSEEHIARWLAGREPGATIPAAKLSALAHAWWDDRVSPDWRPHTREQNQETLERLGLTGAFWQLARARSSAFLQVPLYCYRNVTLIHATECAVE